MDFIVDNIVWFIVGGVVVLMTIVGYLAEKTDFASKKYREKVSREKEDKVINVEKPIDETPDNIQETQSPIQNVGVADMMVKPEEPANVGIEEDLYAPLTPEVDNQVVNDNPIEEDLYAPLSSTNNDSKALEITEPTQDSDIYNVSDSTLTSVTDIAPDAIENTETLEMPIANNMDTLPINDTSDYDKIFPDDPIIINDNKDSEEVTTVVTPDNSINNETEANAEDIWKF